MIKHDFRIIFKNYFSLSFCTCALIFNFNLVHPHWYFVEYEIHWRNLYRINFNGKRPMFKLDFSKKNSELHVALGSCKFHIKWSQNGMVFKKVFKKVPLIQIASISEHFEKTLEFERQ